MALLTQLSCFAHAIVMMGVGGLLVFNQSELKARLNDVNVFCRANVQPHLAFAMANRTHSHRLRPARSGDADRT
jgi:hypothetical protein